MQNLIFWQNIPSIHQAPLVRNVAKRWGGQVTVVAEDDVSEHRRAQGWQLPDFESAKLVIGPTLAERAALVRAAPGETMHIFSGFHAYPQTYWTLRQAAHTPAVLGVFAERGRSGGLKGIVRRLRYRLHAWRWRNRLDFLLATGEPGVYWYRQCGFQKKTIYPFGYFMDANECKKHRTLLHYYGEQDAGLHLLFVGELDDARKGLDLLLNALARLKSHNWNLSVVGSGSLIERYRLDAKRANLDTRIRWRHTIPNQAVRSLMEKADCVVLPSRFDGWGAVVNESLHAGTPVIVSDACGASELVINNPAVGDVFPSESVDALTRSLAKRLRWGRLSHETRDRIRTWANSRIAAATASKYLMDVLDHARAGGERPIPPWRINSDISAPAFSASP